MCFSFYPVPPSGTTDFLFLAASVPVAFISVGLLAADASACAAFRAIPGKEAHLYGEYQKKRSDRRLTTRSRRGNLTAAVSDLNVDRWQMIQFAPIYVDWLTDGSGGPSGAQFWVSRSGRVQ
ncbi:unnamed protein product [Calypogeia fissa]